MSPRLKSALLAGVLFFIVSSPTLYITVDHVFGGLIGWFNPNYVYTLRIAEAGRPTTYGLAVHSAVFATIVYYLMKTN